MKNVTDGGYKRKGDLYLSLSRRRHRRRPSMYAIYICPDVIRLNRRRMWSRLNRSQSVSLIRTSAARMSPPSVGPRVWVLAPAAAAAAAAAAASSSCAAAQRELTRGTHVRHLLLRIALVWLLLLLRPLPCFYTTYYIYNNVRIVYVPCCSCCCCTLIVLYARMRYLDSGGPACMTTALA